MLTTRIVSLHLECSYATVGRRTALHWPLARNKMRDRNPERSTLGSIFDRVMRSLHGLPDTTSTKASTIRTMTPVLELAQTFIVQTYRHRETGDTIFIEYIGTEG